MVVRRALRRAERRAAPSRRGCCARVADVGAMGESSMDLSRQSTASG